MQERQIGVHLHPVWRDRADFIIHARVPDDSMPEYWEQLWARQVADDRFEICCIPFFLYDLSLGDTVETESEGEFQYSVKRVVQPSGHYTFRVWFGESRHANVREEVLRGVARLDCLYEWSSENLLAIDTSEAQAQYMADFLYGGHQRGFWIYETGKMT
ncbi:MAG: DUF4265 domain-containing protein [Armatimonadetes bacterium]|nr:DUF4265 domain-containing protein [Armatimonadota bacterium]